MSVMAISLSFACASRAAVSTTIAGWSLSGGETLSPITWTYNAGPSTLATSTPITFSQIPAAPGSPNDVLSLDFTSAPLAAGTYTLGYSVSLAPNNVFTAAQVSATLAGSNASSVVTETGPSINLSTQGTNGGSNNTFSVAGQTTVGVTETFTVTSGEIISVADTFDTSVVPEPASFVVWGLLGFGGIGASLWYGRRRAA